MEHFTKLMREGRFHKIKITIIIVSKLLQIVWKTEKYRVLIISFQFCGTSLCNKVLFPDLNTVSNTVFLLVPVTESVKIITCCEVINLCSIVH